MEVGKEYHIQGQDGLKFVLDHSSQVEPWPKTSGKDCRKDIEKKCIKNPCLKHNKKKDRDNCEKKLKKKCNKKIEETCSKLDSFDKYVKKLRDGGVCERRDLCG